MSEIIVTRARCLTMQLCAPHDATDEAIVQAAEQSYPCGTTNGWYVVKDGDSYLAPGVPSRVQCANDPTRIHVIVGC